ncbi:MAG: hypothetical protein F8N37_19360 [Telmatospirillum sp.]|nr:hypothetical protein [Telmatospirillum sp.]
MSRRRRLLSAVGGLFLSLTPVSPLIVAAPALAVDAADARSSRVSGDWQDMLWEQDRIGPLRVTDRDIRLGAGGHYRVRFLGRTDGAGMSFDLFEVRSGSGPRDPNGCGPSGRVSFVLISDTGTDARTGVRSILTPFYGGTARPDAAPLAGDAAVCAEHAFGRPADGQRKPP